MPSERAPGFYWVKVHRNGGWQVAEWADDAWWLVGRCCDVGDSDLVHIGERIADHE